ncbi:MetQ/NlpA family ABC transporter substrate-binding protein [Alkalihalobacillus pseudalcaliphilus]|uniref:MetQ/NlpA family ABC transporter substrate-binding protein n=1 Tax=Alkalihalobacillus pseudalcaliphilus TaxID=79884 RepID=UPI00064D8F3F|nr:MetQ/NlpA family ABC transporter substrate-binding protein [Alkalihalobacillus pseudalcaliphilus]KMK75473.1 ABC transporter substrate-binding protein [Alkalihalobacillus pseudalcaliphilus]
MKKLLMMSFIVFLLAACGGQENELVDDTAGTGEEQEEVTLKVASLIPPMTDILEMVEPALAEQGVNLDIQILSDNVLPNSMLASGEVDANFFQHVPFMEEYNRNHDSNLTPIVPIYYANYGVYAKEFGAIEDLPEGASVAIAGDPSNVDRSLALLAQHDVITLQEKTDVYYTQSDIIENPKNLHFEEIDLLMLARAYDDTDAVVMTPAYAAPLGLTPKSDALLTEGTDNEFAITLIAREDNQDSEAIQKLAEAMTSPQVREFLVENFDETAIPAFE